MENLFEFVQIFLCVTEAYLMFDFFMAFFSLRKIFRKIYVKAAIVFGTAVCVRMVNSLDSSMINIIGMQVIYLSLLLGIFYGRILRKFLYYLVATAIMIGCEFIWIVFMSLPADFSMERLQNNQIFTIFTALGLKILVFFCFNIVKRSIKNSNNKTDIKILLLYSIIPIATMGIMIALAYLNIMFEAVRSIQVLLLLSSMLIVLGNILIFYVFDRYSGSMEKLRQKEVIITKMEMEEKHYRQIESVNQEHASFLHDIRHYMRAIGEFAAENKDKEIIDILSELQIKITHAEMEMYCSNHWLNMILNEKRKVAIVKNIIFKIKIEPEFSIDQVENMDLIVIMGNLLDNALEAAEKCPEGFVKVYLYAQNNAAFSVIKIVNGYIGDIIKKEDTIVTSKKNKTMHGFGLQNVIGTVEKYNGYLRNSYKEGIFESVVLLPNDRKC